MSVPTVQSWTREDYARDAREYKASLSLEDVMEATPQGTQREITLVSFNELKSRFEAFGYFNELLVQKFHQGRIERVVPDNLVVLGDPGQASRGSWAVELEASPLLWALEYVSRSNPEKDYVKNFEKYESVFAFPYYLLFDPEQQNLLLYHLHQGRYFPVESNLRDRLPIPELHLEVGLVDGWVRFWFRAELLPVPAELRQQMDELRQEMGKLQAANTTLLSEKETLTAEKQTLTAEKQTLTAQTSRLQTQLKERDEKLQEQQRRADDLFGMLRLLVEAKARQSGREDVLTLLPAATDPQQLQAWLVELS